MRLVIGAVVAVATLVGAGAAAAATITRTATTARYTVRLDVGHSETMYTAAEAKAKHPTSGEVMVGGGSMSMGGSMAGMARHLEVHIRSRATGKPVTSVMPVITLTDTTPMAMTSDKLDVMAMEGVGDGLADLHYGNNVSLTANHVYKVLVTIKGDTATFTFKAI